MQQHLFITNTTMAKSERAPRRISRRPRGGCIGFRFHNMNQILAIDLFKDTGVVTTVLNNGILHVLGKQP